VLMFICIPGTSPCEAAGMEAIEGPLKRAMTMSDLWRLACEGALPDVEGLGIAEPEARLLEFVAALARKGMLDCWSRARVRRPILLGSQPGDGMRCARR